MDKEIIMKNLYKSPEFNMEYFSDVEVLNASVNSTPAWRDQDAIADDSPL